MSGAGYPPGPYPQGAGNPASMPGVGMTLGQILDRVFRLLRANLQLYLGIAVVPALTMGAFFAVAFGITMLSVVPRLRGHAGPPDPRTIAWLTISSFLGFVAIFPVCALYAAASSYAVVRTMIGHALTWKEAWAVALARAGRYIGLMFLAALMVVGPVYAGAAMVGATLLLFLGFPAQPHAPPVGFFLLIPFAVLLILGGDIYALFAFLYLCLSFPACVFEDLRPAEALRRSKALTRGAKGRIFVVLLVVYAVNYAVFLACMAALVLSAVAAISITRPLHLSPLQSAIVVLPFGLVLLAVVVLVIYAFPYAGYTTALGVLYCDQRFRESGMLPEAPPAGEPA